MIAYPSATVAPVKLEEYKIHIDLPGLSGNLVEGCVCYDAFVLDNKKNGIYYQSIELAEKQKKRFANKTSCWRTSLSSSAELRLTTFNMYYKLGM